MSPYGRAGPTLGQQLDEISKMTDEEVEPCRQEIWRLEEEARPSAQAQQDHVLDLYLDFLRSDRLKAEHQNSPKDVIMQTAFPSDTQTMTELFCAFFSFSFSQAMKSGDRLDDQTLAQYRDDLLQIRLERNEVLPTRKLFNRMTETIQQLQKGGGNTGDSEERQEGEDPKAAPR